MLLLLAVMAGAAHADDVDAQKWLRARGFTGELDPIRQPEGCSQIVVGTEREAALQCIEIEQTAWGGEDIPIGRVITHETINVVRGGKLVVVLDASVRFEPFDGLPGMKALLSSKLSVAKDGMSATISSGATSDLWGCKGTLPGGTKEWEHMDAKTANGMCAQRGTYAWTKTGRFERRKR